MAHPYGQTAAVCIALVAAGAVVVKTKKSIKKKLDALWSKIIRSRGACEMCGGQAQNAHHIIGRINYALRWDLRNGVCLCVACHFKAHNSPIAFLDWLWENRPADYIYLQDPKWTKTKTWYLSDYEDIYNNLKSEVI